MTSTELLHSISGGLIESGIKYIMFPLHLLRFCIFGTSKVSEKLAICKDDKGSKDSGSSVKKTIKEETESKSSKSKGDRNSKNDEASSNRRSSEESRKSTRSGSLTDTKNTGSSRGKDSKEVRKGDDKGLKEKSLVVALKEESDSSVDQWSTACNTITENICMDIDKFVTFDSVEPMDISMEEYTYEESQIVTESRDQRQNSTLSVDAEIAKIFQKQCTSSEDEHSSSHSWTSLEKREKTGGKNFLCQARTSHSAATVPSKSKEEKVVKERKKKTSSEDVAHNKRRKVSQVENKPDKQKDGKSDAKRREEKHSSKQDSPSKSKTRSPRTPVKSNESKRKDVQYKEIATQTDSAFSDDDVEMTPVDAKLPEGRFCCKRAAYRSHPNLHLCWGAEHDWNYVADNEDSNDGFASIARKRVSSCSTSSSSTDLGFDENGSPPNSDVGTGRYHTNAHDTITSYRMFNRAPPGFPKLPQNPPLLSYTHTGWYKVATTSLQNNPCGVLSVPTMVPRAPSPMRHLYYNYPEFMDLPTTANSSQVFSNVRNDYYR
ncbi:uncharacterized protein LOC143362160 isoform X2 [Halictus rubicundus]